MLDLLRLLFEPFTFLLLVLGLGLVRLWRRRVETRRRLRLLTVSYLLLVIVSTPAVGFLSLATLEGLAPPGLHRPSDAEAIVVLSGAVAHFDPVLDRSQLSGTSLDRTWHAYRLYRHGAPCLILISGGKADLDDPSPPCADLMEAELRRLGVPARDLLVENASRNTYENAVESARLLRERGLNRVVLVTDAQHMPRAAGCCRKQGLDVVPSACRSRTAEWRTDVRCFVPSLSGLNSFDEAMREWFMLAGHWLTGRI